ncbi:hypothetical protein [Halorhodospira neutriphila]|nr:hypothetical protein [Halorhodospira neutriphila]
MLSTSTLSSMIQSELEAQGFNLSKGEADRLADAVAKAVVEHIQSSAEVPVTSGSSAGTYSVQ